jgi:hypothetical protein
MILARNPVKTKSLSLFDYGKCAMKAAKQWLNMLFFQATFLR